MSYEIIGFWKPNEHYGCFSQWWIDRSKKYLFTDGEYGYICAEQYMMAQKALLFNDTESFEKIMTEKDPVKMKKFGREVKNFDSALWDRNCQRIVYNANCLKFTQNERLKSILLNTGDAKLVEASPYDKIWGIGMSVDDPDFYDESTWEGRNLLGNILMCLRIDLNKGTAKCNYNMFKTY